MSRHSTTQFSQRQRLRELEGYLDALDNEIRQHTSKHLLLPIVRLCELLTLHCGPITTELQSLNRRIAEARFRLDHQLELDDTAEHEITP